MPGRASFPLFVKVWPIELGNLYRSACSGYGEHSMRLSRYMYCPVCCCTWPSQYTVLKSYRNNTRFSDACDAFAPWVAKAAPMPASTTTAGKKKLFDLFIMKELKWLPTLFQVFGFPCFEILHHCWRKAVTHDFHCRTKQISACPWQTLRDIVFFPRFCT